MKSDRGCLELYTLLLETGKLAKPIHSTVLSKLPEGYFLGVAVIKDMDSNERQVIRWNTDSSTGYHKQLFCMETGGLLGEESYFEMFNNSFHVPQN